MAKRLTWSFRAKMDLAATVAFWDENNQNDHYSKKLTKRIFSILTLICENNHLGKLTSIQGVRVTICDSYLIYYEVLKNEILVISIFDGRRNPKKLIL
jgi:toxin YoeB